MLENIAQTHDAHALLNHLFTEEWEFRMHEDPWLASLRGDHRYDNRLPDVSIGEIDYQAHQNQVFLDQLNAINRDTLTFEDQLNYDLFSRDLKNRISEHAFGVHFMPISRTSGFHINFPDLIAYMPFQTEIDYQNYIARLEQFDHYTRQNIDLMHLGIKNGYLPPRVILEGIDRSINALIDPDPANTVFYKPFERIPAAIAERQQTNLRDRAISAISTSVIGGYKALLNFITSEYMPIAREDFSVSSLPEGQSYYRYCVRKFTTLDRSPEEVHTIGLEEVKRILMEMVATMKQAGFSGDFHEFLTFLRNDPRFYVSNPQDLMKEAAWIMKRVDNELPSLFSILPRTPCGLKEIPSYTAPEQTTAYYMEPAGDATTPGYYYVNTYDLKSRPLYEYEALTLHEAIPGHHLQLALQFELTGLPNFRRFADVTAFIEGWALYAEHLGLEMGFYADPYTNFGRLIYEMWRAVRLVVDTGIHNLGWSRQRAIEYMAENTGLSMLNIANEVDRYIAWPGQALAYKTGELKIRELRQRATAKLGPRFNVRDFHAVVLQNGAIPLDTLENVVSRWLEEKRANI